jgi:adenylate cyclase
MLRFFVTNKKETLQFDHPEGPLDFGREPRGPGDGPPRRVVLNDPYVSAEHLRVTGSDRDRVRLENLSKKVAIQVADGTTIGVGSSREVGLPARLTLGQTLIEIRPADVLAVEPSGLLTVAEPLKSAGLARPPGFDPGRSTPDLGLLTRWFEAVISVQRAAAGSSEFYEEIARAVVELIGLDRGLVLLRRGGGWEPVAEHPPNVTPRTEFSRTVLAQVCKERRTFYQATGSFGPVQSLDGVATVVASPILSASGGEVIGTVCGSRGGAVVGGQEIRPLDAQLVQVLAAAAGAGIARMHGEAEAARRHARFEQFFGGELADHLDRDPGLLEGRDAEVSVLVSDVRGFSRIAERLGPRETCDLIGDVLDRLTLRIHEHGGVVVDYAGDGILAMWNAPVAQADHASRVCRAALAMTGELPGLNGRWAARVGAPLALGIGVNTGGAFVGNTGSRQRLKYGPLGNTVNLASRVEGATKPLGVPVLITAGTHARLSGPFVTRRLCQARVVGIATPVDLYELHGETAPPEWLARRDAYQEALALYEQGRLPEACRALFPLLEGADGGHDAPALILAARAIEGLRSGARPFDPVVTLEGK